jgi:hypothetical protein
MLEVIGQDTRWRTVNGQITDPTVVFVFGSNLAGIHGKGAAKIAQRYYQARPGVGEGPTGRAYALPTKDEHLRPRSLEQIGLSVELFLRYAAQHPNVTFLTTAIGCGLAHHDPSEIAPMFAGAGENVFVSPRFILAKMTGP